MRHRRSYNYETRRAPQGLLFDTKSRKITEIRRSAGAGGLNVRCPAPEHPCWDDRYWRQSGRWGLSPIRRMGVYGTTAPEYTCVSLRERTSAHFVRLRTPDLGLTFVLD
jgi:hypothetical protein